MVGFYADLPTYLSHLYTPANICSYDAATGILAR